MSGAGPDTSKIAADIGGDLAAAARQNTNEKPKAPRKQSNTVVLTFASPTKTTGNILEADGAHVASEPVNAGGSAAVSAS